MLSVSSSSDLLCALQGSKAGMEEGEACRTNQTAAGQTSGTPARTNTETVNGVKAWQGHPPPGGGGAGRPPASARKISPAQQAQINKTPESTRTRKSPTPDLSRVRKSPTPENTRMRKSPSPVPSIGRRGSPKKTTKSPSPKGSPQKSRSKASPEPEKAKKLVSKENSRESSQPEGSHYARPTIIESADDPADPVAVRDFTRSVSEPHGGSERDPGNLTGMFFQKLILTEDGGSAGPVYKSNSSLTSQDSSKSGQSRGSVSPRPSKQLQSSKNQPGTPSPNLSAKYGSGEAMFSINKHQKVDLASFDQDQNTTTPR